MTLVYRVCALLTLSVVLGTITGAMAAWERLPAAVQAAGRSLRMTQMDLVLPALFMGGTALAVLLWPLALPRWPGSVNIPGADDWRQLSLADRTRTCGAVTAWHATLALALALTAPTMVWAKWEEAFGRDLVLVHLAVLVLPLVSLVLGFTLFFPRFEAEVAAAKAAAPLRPPASGSADRSR